ncbi:MAG: caspase family protein [Janthinobacterium lividum]
MKRALVIGINAYPQAPLNGCVNDAAAIANTLEYNSDGSPNFSVRLLTSDRDVVTSKALIIAIDELFTGDADTVLFYFAGHGIIGQEMSAGYLVSQDGSRGAWGVSLSELIGRANASYPKIKSTVIVLDSCQSGFAGEVVGVGNENVSVIGTGVTILTASHREGEAAEVSGHGLFTSLLLDGLNGSASDIRGHVTPASLYSLIDQTLGPWEQRPIYKANVQTFVTLRKMPAKVEDDILRKLPQYFPDPTSVFALDPSYEEDRENVPEAFRTIPINAEHIATFKELQKCNRHGLVTPVAAEHMYYAAINSTGCRLTATGAHYRMLAEAKRL